MNLRPLGDRVVVKTTEELPRTLSGIILPETAKEKPQTGEVLAVGKGRIGIDGEREPLDVKEGDSILFTKYGGTEIEVDKQQLLILRESDIISIVD